MTVRNEAGRPGIAVPKPHSWVVSGIRLVPKLVVLGLTASALGWPGALGGMPGAAAAPTYPLLALTVSSTPLAPSPNATAGTATPTSESRIVRFGPSVTAAQLLHAIADDAIDVIELEPGRYTPGHLSIRADRARPLLIRPRSPGSVVWGPGTTCAFSFEEGAGNITIDGLIMDGYRLGQTGIYWLGRAHDITLNDITVRNSTGDGDNSWALYISSDGTAGPTNVVANRWVVDGGNRGLGGLQSNHDPNARDLTANGWTVTRASYALYVNSDASSLRFEDWVIRDSGKCTWECLVVDAVNASGIIRGFRSISSGTHMHAYIVAPMRDDGGNTWD